MLCIPSFFPVIFIFFASAFLYVVLTFSRFISPIVTSSSSSPSILVRAFFLVTDTLSLVKGRISTLWFLASCTALKTYQKIFRGRSYLMFVENENGWNWTLKERDRKTSSLLAVAVYEEKGTMSKAINCNQNGRHCCFFIHRHQSVQFTKILRDNAIFCSFISFYLVHFSM